MNSSFDLVSDSALNPGRKAWRMKVRVVRIPQINSW
jgi:hypothetical protein